MFKRAILLILSFPLVLAFRSSEKEALKVFAKEPKLLYNGVCETKSLIDNVDLTENDTATISCETSRGTSVPQGEICLVKVLRNAEENVLNYRCLNGHWYRNKSNKNALGSRRKKRFFGWFKRVVAAIWYCTTKYGCFKEKVNDVNAKAPPKYTSCPSSNIQSRYMAQPGERGARVQWVEPSFTGEASPTSSQTCCGPYTNGDKFPGSIDGTTHYITYTAKDNYGRTDSCSFSFTVFYLSCSEPYVDDHTKKTTCSDGNDEGSVCQFRCVDGYKFASNGPSTSSCKRESDSVASWSPFPTCEKISCPSPFKPVNGNVSCTSSQYLYDETCVFSCNDGYKLRGPPFMTCMENEQWSKSTTDISCEDNDPPLITCLPHTVYADKGSFSTHVYWEEPTVTDNVDIDIVATKLSTDINQGDLLSQGTYEVSYRATDSTGNTYSAISECSVILEVKVIRCNGSPVDALSDPSFLRYNCSDESYYDGVYCDIGCELNLDLNGSSVMTCERKANETVGVWTWGSDTEPHCIVVECPPLFPPANGAITVDSINARPLNVMACEAGLAVPNVGNAFTGRLSCQDSGEWFPLDQFPDCVEPGFFTIALPAELYYDGDCNDDATKEMIKATVLAYLGSIEADIDNSICPGESCTVDNLEVFCGATRKRKEIRKRSKSYHLLRKRQSGYALVRCNIGAVFNTSNRNAQEAFADLFPKLIAIGERIASDVANGSVDVSGFSLSDDAFVVDSSSSSAKKICPEGTILDGFICKPCPTGTFHSATSQYCEPCPIGQYIGEPGRAQCEKCPVDHSTMKTGSKSISNCTRLCEPGFVSGTRMVPCTACPQGMFQPYKGQTTCHKCPPGLTTPSGNSTSHAMCQPYDIQFTSFPRRQVSHWSSQTQMSVLSLSFWAKLVHGFSPDASIIISDGDNDIIMVNIQESVTAHAQSSEIDIPSMLSSQNWTHFVVEFDFSSYEVRAYVNNVNVVKTTVLAAASLSDAQIYLESSGKLQLADMKILSRTISADEREELIGSCYATFGDELFTLDTIVGNLLDGLIVLIPSTCDPVDECGSSPCGNHICINGIGEFECICNDDWSGDTCEIPPDFCLQNECGEHSICVSTNSTYQCKCTDKFSGTSCVIPPGDGAWSPWSDWSSCGATCGGSIKHRARKCVYTEDGLQGQECTGPSNETVECNTQECPDCPSLKRGRGTRKHCETDQDTGDTHCNLTCIVGEAWPSGQRPYESYSCGRTTGYIWKPFDVLPDCEGYTSPTDLGFTFEANFINDLPTTGKETVETNIEAEANQVNCFHTSKCQMTVDWDQSTRRKRASTGTTIRLLISINFAGLEDLNIAQYLTNGTVSADLDELQSAFSDLHQLYEIFQNNMANIFAVDIDGTVYTLDDSSVLSYLSVSCSTGYAGTDGMCVQCPEGTYESQSVCRSCDLGTYQSQKGQTNCATCPDGFTTATDRSTDASDCSVTVDKSTDDEDSKDEDEEGDHTNIPSHPGSIQRGVIVAIALSCVALVFAVAAVSCIVYKKNARRKHRTDQRGSMASLSQVRPDSDTPYVVDVSKKGYERARSDVSGISLVDLDLPPPYDCVPPKKVHW